MHYTVFNTPIFRHLFYFLSLILFKLSGWTLEGEKPEHKKVVIIAAPHTSNWDLLFALAAAFNFKLDTLYWTGKDEIFAHPLGFVAKWLGGVPVDRSKSNNLVASIVGAVDESDHMHLLIPPEGTRAKVTKWKTGFYHIAHQADIPIILGYLDYERKVASLEKMMIPTGDVDKDMEEIRSHYQGIKGKYPHKWED